jgi:glycosyltransferase involved in cell wall biosynthesis
LVPTASVIIPALNAERTLGETLKALSLQIAAPPHEVIVVDNGSDDATVQIARSFGALVAQETTPGPAAARNRGLTMASGGIIAHLDADTVPSRQWLSRICAPFESAHVILVAGNTVCYPPVTVAERYAQAIGLHTAEQSLMRTCFRFAPSLNMAVRRSAAVRVGGWAEELLTGEDVDFSLRIQRGFRTQIHYAADAILYHRARADGAALRQQAAAYGAGAAELYRRYPNEVRWNLAKTVALVRMLLGRSAAAMLARAGERIGLVDDASSEIARYHAMWTQQFWLGFARRFFSTAVK